ncbi:MAG: MFS transporter [Pseudomonadota bacterium]
MSQRLPGYLPLAYSLPNLVAALPVLPIAVLLPSWYVSDGKLSLVAVGVALGLARFIDFFSDPLVGLLADRTRWRGLRFKHWIVLGAVISALGLFMLGYPPSPASATYLCLWSVVLFTGWTILMVPYTAWGAELADDPHDRSRLTIYRETSGLAGMLLILSLPFFTSLETSILERLPLIALVVGIPALYISMRWVPERACEVPGHPQNVVAAFGELFKLRSFRASLACWLINGIANALPACLFALVASSFFGANEVAVNQLLLAYFGAGVLAMPVWLVAAKILGKILTWRLALGLAILSFAPVLLLSPDDLSMFFVICIASGAMLGADLALPPSIQADVMEIDRLKNKITRTSSAFAIWSMTTKLSFAVAVASGFIGLAMFGVNATDGFDASESKVLLAFYAMLPITLKLIVSVLLPRLEILIKLERNAALDGAQQYSY